MEVGRLMLVGFEGHRPSQAFLDFIREEKVGGVLLFARNIRSAKQIWNLTEELYDASPKPLLIAIDHEGGRVFRMPKPFTRIPSLRTLAAQAREHGSEVIERVSSMMAAELRACGINWNLAPVVDVDTNPFNPIIGDRAFGSNPHEVAEFASLFIKGHEAQGMMTCAKHFPGHGDTNGDSHLELPKLSHTRKRFKHCEFIPFRRVIAENVPSIMTAHLCVPLLDAFAPATISRLITGAILRRDLGYQGLIVTDDLLMKGISQLMSIPEAAVRSLQAGADMVIISKHLELQQEALLRIQRAVDTQEIPEREFRASFERIEAAAARGRFPIV